MAYNTNILNHEIESIRTMKRNKILNFTQKTTKNVNLSPLALVSLDYLHLMYLAIISD